jgi:hypothetical protein
VGAAAKHWKHAVLPKRILIPRFDVAQDQHQALPEKTPADLLPHHELL